MSSRNPLPRSNCLHDLETVELRHVDVQEQQVENPTFGESKCLPTIARDLDAVTPANHKLFEELSVEFIVFGHQNVQCVCGRRLY